MSGACGGKLIDTHRLSNQVPTQHVSRSAAALTAFDSLSVPRAFPSPAPQRVSTYAAIMRRKCTAPKNLRKVADGRTDSVLPSVPGHCWPVWWAVSRARLQARPPVYFKLPCYARIRWARLQPAWGRRDGLRQQPHFLRMSGYTYKDCFAALL